MNVRALGFRCAGVLSFALSAVIAMTAAQAGSLLNAEGLGRSVEGYDIAARGAGWTSIGVAGPFAMSLVNPASTVWTRRPQLSIGLVNENLWIRANGDEQSDRVGELRLPSMHLVLPISSRFRLSLGFRDLTDGRYEINNLVAEGETGEHERIITGSGSLGEFFAGLGYRGPADRFSLGVRYGIVQGTLREEFENDYLGRDYRDSKSVLRTRMEHGKSWELGAQFHPIDSWTLGATFRTEAELDLRSLLKTESGQTEVSDAALEFPGSLGLGVSFQATDQWTVSADVLERKWDDASFSDGSGGSSTSPFSRLQTTRRIGVGIVRHPDPEITATSPLRQQIVWRFGFTVADLAAPTVDPADPTKSGEFVSEWAVTGGFGLPIQFDRGYLDGLLEVGRRGDLDEVGLRETFVRLGFGVTFQRFRRAF